jgi:hypothetical protein
MHTNTKIRAALLSTRKKEKNNEGDKGFVHAWK